MGRGVSLLSFLSLNTDMHFNRNICKPTYSSSRLHQVNQSCRSVLSASHDADLSDLSDSNSL